MFSLARRVFLLSDLEGNERWRADIGSNLDRMRFGSGASPILYRDLLIVNASIEGSAIVALDKRTGLESWKAPFFRIRRFMEYSNHRGGGERPKGSCDRCHG